MQIGQDARLNVWWIISTEIATIKQILDGTTLELDADWPGWPFKRVVESVLIDTGVVHGDSGKKTNPYKRLVIVQKRLGEYMKHAVKLWLRIRTFLSLDELLGQTVKLAETAREVEKAAIAIVQASMPKQPVYCGAISVADVMLAELNHAANIFDQVVAAAVDSEMSDSEIPDFWWGPTVKEFAYRRNR